MKNSLSFQKDYYNKNMAESFDHKRINKNHIYKIETIEYYFEKYTNKNKSLSVLELGGGTAIHAEHFLEKELEYIAKFIFSDLSKDMLEVGKKRLIKYNDNVEYLCVAAEDFKLEKSVDCIYISGAMHHFPNPKRAIINCKSALTEGGIIIICEPVITNPYAWSRVIFKPEEYGQFKVIPSNVRKWLEESEYDILETKYLHYKSNSKLFRFITKFEKISWLNWSAVMFAMVARKRI